jgi:serine/threonine protein kinase/tetratricopeptide (TPR) repeat protein
MSEKPAEIDAEALVQGDLGATSTYRSRLDRTDDTLKAPPPTISGYEVLGELGHGGMGVVYRAKQISLNRIVALKMIRSGDLASTQDLARFRSEAEAVARLKHPNIIHIYEVGDHDGRPYFSLEHVEGGSLEQRVKGTPQPPRLAAELVETLSRATHAAHQSGIVHRDLKPSNVLLTPDGVPKITDFGLAKRLDDDLGQTQTGAVMGTPSYMAPELAAGRSREIGAATDIYALGAILYELVTGRPPFLADSHEATRQLVINDEPLPPRRLQPSLPRSLETICLKCLQKEPVKRYSSALALAEDLRRFLDGKPILARPATVPERFVRWCRRNPWAASFILALVIGTAVSIYFAVDARQKADLAQKHSGHIANTNKIIIDIFADFDIRKVKEGAEPVEAVLAKRLVKAGEQLQGEAIGDPLILAALQNQLGKALLSLGHPQEAVPLLVKARDTLEGKLGTDDPDTLSMINNLAYAYQEAGNLDLSLPLFEQSLKLTKAELGADHPQTLAIMNNLADAYRAAGKLDQALQLSEETFKVAKANLGADHPTTLLTMNTLARAYHEAGKLNLALPVYEQALKLQKATLGADHPDTLSMMSNLAMGYEEAGKPELSLPLYEETLKLQKNRLGADHPNTLATMNNLAGCYLIAGKLDLALPLYEQALKVAKAKLGPDHPDTLTYMTNLATGYAHSSKFELAVPLLEEALELRKAKQGPDHPGTMSTMNQLAETYRVIGKLDKALELFQENLRLTKAKLGNDHPYTLTTMHNLATVHRAAGNLDRALPLFLEAAVGMEKQRFQHQYAVDSIISLVDCYEKLKQFEKAEAWERKWLTVVKERSGSGSVPYAGALAFLGSDLLEQEKWTEAEGVLRECLAIRAKKEPDAWTTFSTQSMLGCALLAQALSASNGGDKEALVSGLYRDAEPLLLRGYDGLKQQAAKIPEQVRTTRLTVAAERLVQLYDAQDKKDEAAKWRKELEALKSK